MPNVTPTPEQQSIIESISSPDSMMIQAFAGCAKTSTLELSAPRVRVPALALAFNKKIADELRPRLPQNFQVKTLNELGHMAWARSLPIPNIRLDDRKLGKLCTEISHARRANLSSEQWDGLRRLVTAAQQTGLVPGDDGDNPLVEDNRSSWHSIADGIGMDLDDLDLLHDLAREVLTESNKLARQGLISFDDQIYCPVVLGGLWPKFPVVFVDEAQDLSPLNHEMLRLASRDDAKLVVVGDQKQAIYAFRGADSRSMETLAGMRMSWQRLPLRTTFRCPKLIVERQQAHAPGFTAWHTNASGEVFDFFPSPNGNYWDHARLLAVRPHESASIAVLCRNNGPLMSLAFKLIRRQVGVKMLGRDIGRGMVGLVKKLAPDSATGIDLLLGKLLEWQEREEAMARANEQLAKLDSIADRAECIRASIEGSEARTSGELATVLGQLFERQSGQITLSSIHRAKGLEWDLVLHLDPWRIPSKWARTDPGQMEQEFNLLYVAETRVKGVLVNANLEDFR